jgi:hypothetical protein
MFVHKFTYDNNAFFEFHPWYFLLKDRDTKNLLLQGRCRNGLYPLPMTAWSSTHIHNKNALVTIKPTLARWHHQLGHASLPIVQRVVSKNNLSCLKEASSESVCGTCQRVKSHQLPFPVSSSVPKAPLELIFWMYGALRPCLLASLNTMSPSLIITASLLRSTS